MSARDGHGTMNECEFSINALRQNDGIFIVWLHNEPVPLERSKILGERQRDSGPSSGKSRISDDVLTQLIEKCDSRVLNPPEFLRKILRIGRHGGSAINFPAANAIL